ncbi:GGDEF domain-containing protein [Curvibacter sp. HBC61]|uniref:diguanylate cyclase n=1 Tax=Curvibacter cyanobacteriorum TaxID=3026422 RepID=A0ABT5MWJ0_9BURK|nr:GGDEF domain-containing protein [Curvibacter sp. HBC61]MDD0837821.1 GGDEF domain-containing protein [Curvibacter sp. HBC61]
MHPLQRDWHKLRLLHQRWLNEHDRVTGTAGDINLQRLRLLAPAVAVINGLLCFVFGMRLLLADLHATVQVWQVQLLLAHLVMGGVMVALAAGAQHWRHASRRWFGRWLPTVAMGLSLGFSVLLACIDQLVTPSIAPFLLGCMMTALAFHQRPTVSGLLYGASAIAFFVFMGQAQDQAEALLSNRINGVAGCVMGWTLSVMLWRKFTLLTLQQAELEKANNDLQIKQRELERLTRVDGLTGLLNRLTFVELTRGELARARRQGTATTLLVLDLDHFKRINDSWGHPAGDAVLRHVAALCMGTVRSTDLVGRLGGEEFIVLLPATTPEAGRKLAEKLRQRLEQSPVRVQDQLIQVTASIGLSGAGPQDKTADFDSLYQAADQALYLAKHQGRNRVV